VELAAVVEVVPEDDVVVPDELLASVVVTGEEEPEVPLPEDAELGCDAGAEACEEPGFV
jgi:hypothetical protein